MSQADYEHEIFRLPDGTEVGTGLQPSTEDDVARVMAAYDTMSEDDWYDDDAISSLQSSYDYRLTRQQYQPWMLNQANLGMCNAAATIHAVHRMREEDGQKHIPFSPNQLYMRINGGRDNGSALQDGMEAAQSGGLSPRKLNVGGKDVLFPWDVYNTRQVDPALYAESERQAKFNLAYKPLAVKQDYHGFVMDITTAIARRWAVIFAWHVGPYGTRLDSDGYVIQGSGVGNHAGCLFGGKYVGGKDRIHPDYPNTWGPSVNPMYGPVQRTGWGEGGFGKWRMQDLYRCRKYHMFWILKHMTITDKPRQAA